MPCVARSSLPPGRAHAGGGARRVPGDRGGVAIRRAGRARAVQLGLFAGSRDRGVALLVVQVILGQFCPFCGVADASAVVSLLAAIWRLGGASEAAAPSWASLCRRGLAAVGGLRSARRWLRAQDPGTVARDRRRDREDAEGPFDRGRFRRLRVPFLPDDARRAHAAPRRLTRRSCAWCAGRCRCTLMLTLSTRRVPPAAGSSWARGTRWRTRFSPLRSMT